MPRPLPRELRERVLAFCAEHPELTVAEVARRFELPPTTVRSWLRRAQRREAEAPEGSAPDKSARKRKRPRRKKGARVALRAEDLDAESAPMLRAAALRLLRYLAGEAVDDDGTASLDEEALRAAGLDRRQAARVRRMLEETAWTPKGAQAAAVALAVLVDECPEILSLGDRLEGQGGGDVGGPGGLGGPDAAERLRAALREGGPGDEG